MPSTTKRYPLSTPDGSYIPLDVIKPNGLILLSHSAVVSASISIPEDIEIISFLSSTDCLVNFGGTASVPADGVLSQNTVLIPADMRISVAPTSTTFTVISYSDSGIISCQLIDKWAGLTLETQQQRR